MTNGSRVPSLLQRLRRSPVFYPRLQVLGRKALSLPGPNRSPRVDPGFTLVELLVVMAIIATLLSIVAPRYFNSLDRSRETVLRQDLNIMRDAIDKFNSDTGKYPADLAELVEKRYLRAVPVDPLTESSETWVTVPPPNADSGIYDIHSGSSGEAKDGTLYADW